MRRRDFLKNIGLGMGGGIIFLPEALKGESKSLIKNIPATRVVQIHNPNASNWDFASSYYGDYVNQSLVDTMADRGVCELTGLSDAVSAWQRIMSSYNSGDKIAIRVKFNCIILGLTRIGVPASDIWVYDASRTLPNRFTSGCLYSARTAKLINFCRLWMR